ncbi:MAG: hypothetical protein ABJF89_09845 [Parasphingorhabdus sp.]|uniref:hypothetical protein n=1 Tax=Parasphingorhabdus sp. TaxID=2709688 RepID=UPI0032639E64
MISVLIVAAAILLSLIGFYLIVRASIWLSDRKYKRFTKLKRMGGAVGTSGPVYSSYGLGETDIGGDCGGGGD